jgi:hypothetical protein
MLLAKYIYEIQSHPGVHLVNPLSFSAIKGLMNAKAVAIAPQFKGYTGDLCLVETDGIAFKIEKLTMTMLGSTSLMTSVDSPT